MENYEGALKDYEQALKINPLNEIAKENLDNLNKKFRFKKANYND